MEFGMDVTKTNGWTVLSVSGEVDVATAPSLRERTIELIDGGTSGLIIDLAPVEFLDSTGLGVLVGALKRIREVDGRLRLVIPQERIVKLFDITGLSQIFEIHGTRETALVD